MQLTAQHRRDTGSDTGSNGGMVELIHVGDITKLRGCELDPVDVVTGGSPCQDLSVAGKREGLSGEHSGLFMEQIRVIKELRAADERRGYTNEFIRPRFMVWENVPGAFSSNRGEDFGAVLHETIKIICPQAPAIPVPKNGWPTSGSLTDMGGGWSVAWRVLDAQFWGVPQRRRRIALVADFGGRSAPEILFIRNSLQRNITPGGTPRQSASGTTPRGVTIPIPEPGSENSTDKCLTPWESQRCRIHQTEGVSPTLDGSDGGGGRNPGGLFLTAEFNGHKSITGSICYNDEKTPCLESKMPSNVIAYRQRRFYDYAPGVGTLTANPSRGSTSETLVIFDARGNGNGNISPTLIGHQLDGVGDYTALILEKHAPGVGTITANPSRGSTNETLAVHQNASGELRLGGVANTLSTNGNPSGRNAPLIMASGQANAETLADILPISNSNHDQPIVIMRFRVRRLTPLECERLQGYPDGWTDIPDYIAAGKKRTASDSARYKALGNSIALPPWKWVLKRIAAQYERDATLGSLFDGIGGFPLIWEQINGVGSALWASEVEPFCIAVTEYRFCGREV